MQRKEKWGNVVIKKKKKRKGKRIEGEADEKKERL